MPGSVEGQPAGEVEGIGGDHRAAIRLGAGRTTVEAGLSKDDAGIHISSEGRAELEHPVVVIIGYIQIAGCVDCHALGAAKGIGAYIKALVKVAAAEIRLPDGQI